MWLDKGFSQWFKFLLSSNDAFGVFFFCCLVRYHLSEEGEWLVKELGIEVEREENGSVSLQELRRITKLASQW